MKQLRIWAWSLGCPKNRVDTEHLLGALGPQVTLVSSPRRCDVAFINTCAFIEHATRESLRAVFDTAARIKRMRPRPKLIVAGCLPGRYGVDALASEMPEVSLWLHPHTRALWPQQLATMFRLQGEIQSGRPPQEKAYAWLKIADGCHRRCSYCTIPAIRGPLESVDARTLVEESRGLVEAGVKELILVAQDTTAWGRDVRSGASPGPHSLPDLLLSLAATPGLRWLRILYLYPGAVTDHLLYAMRDRGRPLLPYLDIPLQHSEAPILRAMGRPAKESPLALVERIRHILPQAVLRATLMTGFPGETEADFQRLCQFVRDAQLQHLGVFAFQAEEGTSAALMDHQVPAAVREERRRELMAIQEPISRSWLQAQVGSKQDVLVDSSAGAAWPGLHQGHTWFQCPETDGVTYVSGPGVQVGAMMQCDIVDAQSYDLSALA